jgi:hypothetical protein
MAANYIFSVKTVKYGTPTGTNTMPATGDMNTLPDTVRGSVTISETEGTLTKFYVDQKAEPVKVIKTEEGEMTAVMQFYDLTYATIAALKGGTGDASGYTPATGYTLTEKAIEIETESGHKFDMYNAQISARIMDGGSRDKLFSMEVTINPQMSADSAGSWKVRPAS